MGEEITELYDALKNIREVSRGELRAEKTAG